MFANQGLTIALGDIPDSRKVNIDDVAQVSCNMAMDFIGDIPTLHAYGKRHGLVPIAAACEQFAILKKRGFNPILIYGKKDDKLWGLSLGSQIITLDSEDGLIQYLAQQPDLRADRFDLLPGE